MCWALWVTLTTTQVTTTRWFIVMGDEWRKKDESKRMHALLCFIAKLYPQEKMAVARVCVVTLA